ncbi:head maturation protease, ClpP-related [Caballeronia sp. KNU42]
MTKKRQWYSMRALTNAAGAAVAEIRIYDEIGFWGTTAQGFIAELEAVAAGATEIVVAVNSPGGDVFDAFAIYNALRRYAGKVTTRVDGVAASAASLVVMAGDQVVMPENAMMMIHNIWTVTAGTADELRTTADLMDKTRDGVVAAYRNKTSLEDQAIIDMLDAETWMTALEAQALGFADVIEQPVKFSASVRTAELVAKFKSTPTDLQASIDSAEVPDPTVGGDPPEPEPIDPPPPPPKDPVVLQEAPGVLAAHVFSACREAGLLSFAEGIVASTGLKDRATIDSAMVSAREISSLCAAAKLPELAAEFVATGLNTEQVRARLFDCVTNKSTTALNNRQPVVDLQQQASGPHRTSIYAARRTGAKQSTAPERS